MRYGSAVLMEYIAARDTKELSMRIHYWFKPLSCRDAELIAMMLCDEIYMQRWFAVACSSLMNEEILLTLQ
jgi:hypothetical protein